MVYLPNEIINQIIMFRNRHSLFMMMKYLIVYCYNKVDDFNKSCFLLFQLRREINKSFYVILNI